MRGPTRVLCAALWIAALPIAARGQLCVGDCDGSGTVSVAELIQGVRISLGDLPIATCSAFDATPDGTLRIDELVRGVSDLLGGCPATPTASPSPSPSETPTPTASPPPTDTPTATPTVPVVSGTWREDSLAIVSSTCAQALTSQFAAELAARPPCTQTVTATSDTTVTVLDCTATSVDGVLERDGTIEISYPSATQTVEGCDVTLDTSAVIPAAASPTTAHYTFRISFGGTCPLSNCAIAADGTWTRL